MARRNSLHDNRSDFHSPSGIWFPIFSLVGSVLVCVQLRDAPASHAKRAMMVLAFLTPIWLICFIITMVVLGSQTSSYYYYYGLRAWEPSYSVYERNLEIASGVMLTIYGLLCGAFIACADITFRSTVGPVTSDLSDPLYLRGVNLGVNLAGLFMFPWCFGFVGIPLVLHQLQKKRTLAKGYGASLGLGITTYIFLVAIVITLIVSGSIQTTYYDYYDRYYHGGGACPPQDQPIPNKRHVLQDETTGGSASFTSASNSTTTVLDSTFTSAFDSAWSSVVGGSGVMPTWSSVFGGSGQTTWSGWATPPPTPSDWVCHDIAVPYEEPTRESAIKGGGAAAALSILSVIYFFLMTAFIAVADAMVLKLIAPTPVAGAPSGQQQIVAPCVSCNAPLAFLRTGPTTQVQCYQCKAICEFQVA